MTSGRSTPSDEELKQWKRERQQRRMPGHARVLARRNAEMFSAAVRQTKRRKK